MYPNGLPEVLKDATQVLVRCDECGQERSMAWVNARRNFAKYNERHVLRCCNVSGKFSYHQRDPELAARAHEKSKQTSLERYGVEMVLNKQENIEARREQFKNQEYLDQRTKRRKETCLEKYGVEHPMHNEEVKQKVQDIFIEKYGVTAPLKNKDILEKTKQTNLERYGVDNVAKVPEVQEKISQTMMGLYGVRHYNELPEMREWMRENGPKFLRESYTDGHAIGVARPKEWNEKQSRTVAALIMEGKWNNSGPKNTKRGWFESKKCPKRKVFFRSSWELMLMMHLEENPDCVIFDCECLRIPYEDADGEVKNYVPDFMVTWNNEETPIEIIEIKSEYLLNMENTTIKLKEAERVFREAGVKFSLYRENDMLKFNKNKETIFLDPRVTLAQ